MTDKQLLLADLCARLPYRPLVKIANRPDKIQLPAFWLGSYTLENVDDKILEIKPFLRPEWQLTPKELTEYTRLLKENNPIKIVNWMYQKHLDINGLIKLGLALPVNMYFYKTN